eukprot:5393895-Amphidinium_carterae.1
MHAKCLTALGQIKPKCLYCEELKVKTEPRGGGGGGDPNPDDHDYGEGGPNWGKGRRDRDREREKKPTKEDMISKIASRVLPKLEVSHALNLWSPLAANTFRTHLENAQTRHEFWTKMPNVEKLQFERQYTYGLGQLPPVQAFLE